MAIDRESVRDLLEWRDAALRTCEHLGMLGYEFGAYILLCRQVGKVPVVGGVERPDLLKEPAAEPGVAEAPAPVAEVRRLVMTRDAAGKVSLTGDLRDKMAALNMLLAAIKLLAMMAGWDKDANGVHG